MDSQKSYVLAEHARTEKQAKIMAQIQADNVCPFCVEHFKKYHTEPIIKQTETWIVTTNFSPYEGAVHHFLFVYKPAHIKSPGEMTDQSRIELFTLVEELTKQHSLEGGSILMRFGDGLINGSSVEHLHAHLIVGEKKSDSTEGLKVKLGYKEKTA